MVITLFGDVRVRPGMEGEKGRRYDELLAATRSHAGFLSMKYYTAEDGERIGVIRFATRESLDQWLRYGPHVEAQEVGHAVYESFWIQSAETFREYRWEESERIEEDLTHLFTS